MIGVIYLFFAYFWVHGGQTLGMRAWRFRLLRDDGEPLTTADAGRRLLWSTLVPAPLDQLTRRSTQSPSRMKSRGGSMAPSQVPTPKKTAIWKRVRLTR